MATVNEIFSQVIFEENKETLKVWYDIDVTIKEKPEEETETPETETPEAETPAEESTKLKGRSLNEVELATFKQRAKGEIVVPKQDLMNIQTIQDLISFLYDKDHIEQKTTSVGRALGKSGSPESQGKIVNDTIQELLLVLTGTGSGQSIDEIIDRDDKIIIEIKYGAGAGDNIGFKVNKNSGTDVASISIVKNDEIVAGNFSSDIINKQILFYRNSLA